MIMGTSDVRLFRDQGDGIVDVEARGGTRRERGAAIAAQVRQYPTALERVRVSYSETYGFLPATFARYRVAS